MTLLLRCKPGCECDAPEQLSVGDQAMRTMENILASSNQTRDLLGAGGHLEFSAALRNSRERMCTIHGKNRLMNYLQDDGHGNLTCKEGWECKGANAIQTADGMVGLQF